MESFIQPADESFQFTDVPEADGYRVLDLALLIKFINMLTIHSSTCFSSIGINFIDELRIGIACRLRFKCSGCNKEFSFESSNELTINDSTHKEVNAKTVFGVVASGSGYSDLTTILGIMGVPNMSKKCFYEIQSNILDIVEIEAKNSMANYAQREKEMAIAEHRFSDMGSPSCAFVSDAGWSHRSYNSYDALSATLPIIGMGTKKIIECQIANKFCYICNMKGNVGNHRCFKNYVGTSQGMESEMAIRGVQYLAEQFDLHCDCAILDGDSNTFKKLRDNFDWTIIKKECLNHLMKNYKGRLLELQKMPDYINVLSDSNIDKILSYTRHAINTFGKDSNRDENSMSIVIKNVSKHLFGFHKDCTDHLCNKPKDNIESDFRVTGPMLERIVTTSIPITTKIDRVFDDVTTNMAENFHSIRAKLDAGKFRNYVMRGSFNLRTYCAVLRFNCGVTWAKAVLGKISRINKIMSDYFDDSEAI